MKVSGYDRIARCYRLLELIAFGHALERARFRHFEHLRGRKRILLLGDGDGRALALACKLAPDARIESLDISAGMIARAARRLSEADHARVTWRHEDALTAEYPKNTYDAVVTLFFFDCFSSGQVKTLIDRLRPALTADAVWLEADFALPARGWMRLRARVWLTLMYVFFHWQTGLAVRELPPVEILLKTSEFQCIAEAAWQGGFLRSTVFARPSLSLNK